MITRTIRSTMAALLAVGLIAALLVGCAPAEDPTATVKGFYNALQKGEFARLSDYMEDAADLDAGNFDDPKDAEILRKMFAQISYTVAPKATVQGAEATVTVSVTGVDFGMIVATTLIEAFEIMFAAAFLGDEAIAEAEAKVHKLFEDAVTDPEAPKKTSDITLRLKKVEGKWLIAKGENPLSFITDDLDQFDEWSSS